MSKRAVKSLRKQLRGDPDNAVLRLKLAAALHDEGDDADAVALYRSVGLAYRAQGRLGQAVAVLEGASAMFPDDAGLADLCAQLSRERQQVAPAATIVRDEPEPIPSLAASRERRRARRRSSVTQPPGDASQRPRPPTQMTPSPEKTAVWQPAASTSSNPITRPELDGGHRSLGSNPSHASLPLLAGDRVRTVPAKRIKPPSAPPKPMAKKAPSAHDVPTRVAAPGEIPADRPESGDTPSPEEATRVFERSFEPTLERLDPDGSAIDVPLPLLADLSSNAAGELRRGVSRRKVARGEVVVLEGDPGDACFVVLSGDVRVLKRAPEAPAENPAMEIARLGHGAVFGELALIAERRRFATVQAVSDCELCVIPRALLRGLVKRYPEVRPALQRFCRERLLSTLLATSPLFRPLLPERRVELLARFVPAHAKAGEAIVSEGERAGGLYLIILGGVDILKRAEGRHTRLASLGEGSYFGEMSLLEDDVASASVVATRASELAVLPPRAFYDLVIMHPVLWDSMRREAKRRALDQHRIVTGETAAV